MEIYITPAGIWDIIEIGETMLQEEAINIWEFPPPEVYKYYSKNDNIMYTLVYRTRIDENNYKKRHLNKDEITPEIINHLRKMNRIIV